MNDVVYLEIGARNPGDTVIHPDDDSGRASMPDATGFVPQKVRI
jgi:uncharacterized cupin superfamily protein